MEKLKDAIGHISSSLDDTARKSEEYQLLRAHPDGEPSSPSSPTPSTSTSISPPIPARHAHADRPPISCASPGAFARSARARFASLWTPTFTFSLLAGQALSVSITGASVLTALLVKRQWVLPATQAFFPYVGLMFVFTPYTMYKYGLRGWYKMVLKDGWKYFLLALGDVEGNFLAIKAYDYTDLLSAMLLDAWAIPVCLFSCYLFMHTRYHWTQIIGVVVSILGLCMLVASDFLAGNEQEAGVVADRAKGDLLMLCGATLFGIVNATTELFVRNTPMYEVVGQVGFWGTIVCGIQAYVLEHEQASRTRWKDGTGWLLLLYVIAMDIVYALAPVLFRTASSSFFNISLLTSDFYGLLFGLFLFHYSPYWLYFLAFPVVISGLVLYFWHAEPEDEGETHVRAPKYLDSEAGLAEEEGYAHEP